MPPEWTEFRSWKPWHGDDFHRTRFVNLCGMSPDQVHLMLVTSPLSHFNIEQYHDNMDFYVPLIDALFRRTSPDDVYIRLDAAKHPGLAQTLLETGSLLSYIDDGSLAALRGPGETGSCLCPAIPTDAFEFFEDAEGGREHILYNGEFDQQALDIMRTMAFKSRYALIMSNLFWRDDILAEMYVPDALEFLSFGRESFSQYQTPVANALDESQRTGYPTSLPYMTTSLRYLMENRKDAGLPVPDHYKETLAITERAIDLCEIVKRCSCAPGGKNLSGMLKTARDENRTSKGKRSVQESIWKLLGDAGADYAVECYYEGVPKEIICAGRR